MDDLVKRLREGDNFERVMSAEWAADRIEELEAEVKSMAMDCLVSNGQACDAYQAQLAAEAKLAKAMKHVMDYSNDPHLVKYARAALAEHKPHRGGDGLTAYEEKDNND